MTFPFLDHSYLDGHGAGVLPLSSGSGNPGLGQELLMNDSGALSPVSSDIAQPLWFEQLSYHLVCTCHPRADTGERDREQARD